MRARRRVGHGVLAAIAIVAASAAACSSSSNGTAAGCEGSPLACPAGTTCWPEQCLCPSGKSPCDLTNCTPRMACLKSAPNKQAHDPCNDTVGTPTCSDGQACVEFQTLHGGCLAYCDASKPNDGCPAGETCISVKVGQTAASPSIQVCAVVGGDAGGLDAAAPAEDSGSSDAVSEPD